MRPRVIMVLALATLVIGGFLVVPGAYARLSRDGASTPATDAGTAGGRAEASAPSSTSGLGSASPTPTQAPGRPTLAAGPVDVTVDGFFSWALLDRTTGAITGSDNLAATNSTESMIKIWIVSDHLRRAAEDGEQPPAERLAQASTAIRDSDDDAAQSLYELGGGTDVVRRMISMCGLTDTTVASNGWWSYTQMSARDAVRLADCVKTGTAAGPKWTGWVLSEMTKVRGTTAAADQHERSGGGRWGIIDGLPSEIVAQGVGIKNGWTAIWADGNWHINCLAVADGWALAVMMRYPIDRGLDYGANVCRSVAEQLVVRPAETRG